MYPLSHPLKSKLVFIIIKAMAPSARLLSSVQRREVSVSTPSLLYSNIYLGFLMRHFENVLENAGMPMIQNFTHNPMVLVR